MQQTDAPVDDPTNTLSGFTIGEHIGNGARSSIYLVTEMATGRDYALKRVIKRDSRDHRYFEQVYNEFAVSSKTDHPALRRSFRLWKVRKFLRVRELLLLMEHARGQTIEQSKPTDLVETSAIFLDVARGLEALHHIGYVHADIKPNNIIVGPDRSVKIIDFGQSCPIGFVKPRIQGTPDYIAPEQVRRLPLDQRTDVFNFGATLYWVLTGRPYPTLLPSRRHNGIELVHERAAVMPHEANPLLPPSLSRLVMDCVQSNPPSRPTDMREVIARLEVVQHILANHRPNQAANGQTKDQAAPKPSSQAL